MPVITKPIATSAEGKHVCPDCQGEFKTLAGLSKHMNAKHSKRFSL